MMATTAASNVLNIYRNMTVLNLDPNPNPAFEIAEATRTNTKIGAIALSASTNSSPKKPTNFQSGTKTPKTAPIIMPTTIFKIKLDSVHFLIIPIQNFLNI